MATTQVVPTSPIISPPPAEDGSVTSASVSSMVDADGDSVALARSSTSTHHPSVPPQKSSAHRTSTKHRKPRNRLLAARRRRDELEGEDDDGAFSDATASDTSASASESVLEEEEEDDDEFEEVEEELLEGEEDGGISSTGNHGGEGDEPDLEPPIASTGISTSESFQPNSVDPSLKGGRGGFAISGVRGAKRALRGGRGKARAAHTQSTPRWADDTRGLPGSSSSGRGWGGASGSGYGHSSSRAHSGAQAKADASSSSTDAKADAARSGDYGQGFRSDSPNSHRPRYWQHDTREFTHRGGRGRGRGSSGHTQSSNRDSQLQDWVEAINARDEVDEWTIASKSNRTNDTPQKSESETRPNPAQHTSSSSLDSLTSNLAKMSLQSRVGSELDVNGESKDSATDSAADSAAPPIEGKTRSRGPPPRIREDWRPYSEKLRAQRAQRLSENPHIPDKSKEATIPVDAQGESPHSFPPYKRSDANATGSSSQSEQAPPRPFLRPRSSKVESYSESPADLPWTHDRFEETLTPADSSQSRRGYKNEGLNDAASFNSAHRGGLRPRVSTPNFHPRNPNPTQSAPSQLPVNKEESELVNSTQSAPWHGPRRAKSFGTFNGNERAADGAEDGRYASRSGFDRPSSVWNRRGGRGWGGSSSLGLRGPKSYVGNADFTKDLQEGVGDGTISPPVRGSKKYDVDRHGRFTGDKAGGDGSQILKNAVNAPEFVPSASTVGDAMGTPSGSSSSDQTLGDVMESNANHLSNSHSGSSFRSQKYSYQPESLAETAEEIVDDGVLHSTEQDATPIPQYYPRGGGRGRRSSRPPPYPHSPSGPAYLVLGSPSTNTSTSPTPVLQHPLHPMLYAHPLDPSQAAYYHPQQQLLQPVFTGSGHVLLMTEGGLMVPSDGYPLAYSPSYAATGPMYVAPAGGAVYYPPPQIGVPAVTSPNIVLVKPPAVQTGLPSTAEAGNEEAQWPAGTDATVESADDARPGET
ncbi:hypothetical protein DFJ73DRAFT_792946 [Zopfochytrium polystomum]|nr:hypothetical protein DFJ73DRAFT_792946 [Zopfochytrium polystomum]